MMPETYTFTGNAITFIGLVGVSSALLITVVAFRRYFNSPINTHYQRKDLDKLDDIFDNADR
jgi:hypothetical protein